MSNPADVVAMDDLRAVIGREFVAVVASGEQIDSCLTRIYGEPALGTTKRKSSNRSNPPAPVVSTSGSNGTATKSNSQVTSPAHAVAPMPVAPPVEEAQRRETEKPSSAAPPAPMPLLPPLAPVAPSTMDAVSDQQSALPPMASSPPPLRATAAPSATPASDQRPEDALAAALQVMDTTLGAHRVADVVGSESTVDPGAPAGTVISGDPDGRVPGAHDLPEEPVAAVVADVVAAADLVDEVVGEYEQTAESVVAEEVPEGLAGFPPLARVLVEGERVSLEEMEDVLEERKRSGQAIARILTLRGLVTEADLMWGMAQEMGLEFVDLEIQSVDFAAAYHLPEATARHHNVLVIALRDNVPVVAASNPTDVFAMDDLRTIIGRNFVTVVATRSQISSYIDKAYHQGGDASEVATAAASDFEDLGEEGLGNIQAVVDDAPIVRYVNLLVLQALNERASDIHVEPTGENLRIRYRIDGVLHDISTAPRAIASAVTTRLKVMADLNIAEHRLPQDGRLSLTVGNRPIDLRMATLPTIYGEKVVMRVLDKTNVVLGFEDLGFDADLMEIYKEIYNRPYGTILVTGPTGSGKTTTLYATLAALNNPEKNIITVEDPVELRIKGITQVQLNVKAGLTFAAALRSILRSDPDIVLVGEIRDRETALISIEAALTGHMVLATLHTNNAASTPMRLVEMGIEPFLVTSAITGALAQRLARRLCVHCREPFDATEADIVAAGWKPAEVYADTDTPTLYRAVGCPACSNTGYRGRKALLELLVVTEDVERLIIEGGTADDIHKLAVEQGMVTLRQSGVRKALEGETTLEEVLRVVS
jgi:type IV pilus assembly protein PilB